MYSNKQHNKTWCSSLLEQKLLTHLSLIHFRFLIRPYTQRGEEWCLLLPSKTKNLSKENAASKTHENDFKKHNSKFLIQWSPIVEYPNCSALSKIWFSDTNSSYSHLKVGTYINTVITKYQRKCNWASSI